MCNLYENIYALCNEHDITPGGLCSKLGFRRSVLSDLKSGRKKSLDTTTLLKIASFFGVSVDYLLGTGQKETAPALTEKDRRDVAHEVERIMDDLEHSGDLMFDGVPMSLEAKESMATAMRMGLEMARLKNKETYTPKKYRMPKE